MFVKKDNSFDPGIRLRQALRKRKYISAKHFSKALNEIGIPISRSCISRLLLNKKKMTVYEIEVFCEVLELSADYFVGRLTFDESDLKAKENNCLDVRIPVPGYYRFISS